MKKSPFVYSAAAAFGLLASLPAVHAAAPRPQLVTTASPFSFDLIGANTNGDVYYLVGPSTANFGVTSTVLGPDGQTITISSSESIGVSTTTDTFTLSTPLNFYNEATADGYTNNALQFDIGDADSGSPSVPVVFAITSYSGAGTYTDGSVAGNSVQTLPIPSGGVNTFVATDGMSYGAAVGVNSGSSAISTFDVHGFTYSITYNTVVPEPSTWAALAVGIAAGSVGLRRRTS